MAKAAGLRAIITSSSDEKLERARELGADETINYRATPEWQDEVLRRTDGKGVDLVLEVGGQGTITRSVASTAVSGTVAVIGGVSGFGGEVNPTPCCSVQSAWSASSSAAGPCSSKLQSYLPEPALSRW